MLPRRAANFLLPFCVLLFSPAAKLGAQPGSISEQQITQEKQFIEAKREALMGNFAKALDLFSALAKIQVDNDVLFFEIGRLHYTQEDNLAAIQALEKAYTLQPSPAYAGLLGEVYRATGRNREGARLYAQQVKNQPEVAENYLEQALFLVRAQQIDEAIKVYNELEKRLGVNAELSQRKHALYLGQGDVKRAEKELLNLVAAFPAALEYRHLLAGFYQTQGNRSAAENTYREILAIQPADVKAQLVLQAPPAPGNPAPGASAELLALLGRSEVPIDLKIGKLLPIIQSVADQGDRALADEGLVLANELTRVHPDEAKAYAITGDLYYYSGRYAEAATAYRRTLALDDNVYLVWEQLLHAQYQDNQLAELLQTAENALDIFPNRPYIYFYAGLGAAARGDFAAAVEWMQQAELIFSAAKLESAAMARSYRQVMETLAAGNNAAVTDLPTTSEDNPLAVYLRARQALEKGDYQAVVQLLGPADHPRNTFGLQLELLGDASLALGRKVAAAQYYQRAQAARSQSKTLANKLSQSRS